MDLQQWTQGELTKWTCNSGLKGNFLNGPATVDSRRAHYCPIYVCIKINICVYNYIFLYNTYSTYILYMD